MVGTCCCLALAGRAAPTIYDYNRDIRPILSENCFSCHGPDESGRKGKRRLDVAEAAYADREGTIAIKPGVLSESDAWTRIISEFDDEVMPPKESHLTLTVDQKAKIKGWIEQGAVYQEHWSLVVPKKAPLPVIVGAETASLQPIDRFIRATLAEKTLSPAPEADRATLLRRISLDLTGLPPSQEDVAAFVNDKSPDAYTRWVDRLLESPHFGERMALDWLDAARYADTNGYSIDGGRHMWLWRDWVIQSFNDNLPYDRFLTDQLAGDLIPDRTSAQLIATGFQRNNMVTHEGGTIPEENLTNYNVDRVKTFGEAVLGLTLACAQCHDHKFDPISQEDYFRLYSFFNTLSDKGNDGNGGVNPGPSIRTRTVLKSDEAPQVRRQIAALKAELERPDTSVLRTWEAEQLAMLQARGKNFQEHAVKVIKVSTPNKGSGFDADGENRVRLNDPPGMAAFDILTALPSLDVPITGFRVRMHPVPELPGGGWGAGPITQGPRVRKEADGADGKPDPGKQPEKGSFMLTAIAATADVVPSDQINLHRLQSLAHVTANSWQADHPPRGLP